MQFHPTLQNSKESESNSYWAINFHHQLQKPNNHRDRFEKISESWVSHVHSGDVETDGKALLFFFQAKRKKPSKRKSMRTYKGKAEIFLLLAREREGVWTIGGTTIELNRGKWHRFRPARRDEERGRRNVRRRSRRKSSPISETDSGYQLFPGYQHGHNISILRVSIS